MTCGYSPVNGPSGGAGEGDPLALPGSPDGIGAAILPGSGLFQAPSQELKPCMLKFVILYTKSNMRA
ncbi:Uncharacterised protein [Mycobacteroides abscessus subsp. abscessus]|nr:Uncharacterised protein [Mycobacteroides abscessus subsp. abscessus]